MIKIVNDVQLQENCHHEGRAQSFNYSSNIFILFLKQHLKHIWQNVNIC